MIKMLNEADTLTLAFNILEAPSVDMNRAREMLILNSSRELSSFMIDVSSKASTFLNPNFTYFDLALKMKFKIHHGKVNQALLAATLLLNYKIGSTGR